MTIDTKQLRESIDLRAIAANYTELHNATNNEMHGPCPFCGGTKRFRVTADFFACRPSADHCGRKGDAIQFIMLIAKVDFRQACTMLSGGTLPDGAKVMPVTKAVTKAVTYDWDEPLQRRKLLDSHAVLMEGKAKQARPVLGYLQGRGLEPATLEAFKVGYHNIYPALAYNSDTKQEFYPKQWAAALPWFDRFGSLVAVKYRFIEKHNYLDYNGKQQEDVRMTSRGSARGHVFGWHTIKQIEERPVLVVCEGELNAMSIWQVGFGLIDVLSTGSEGMLGTLPADVATAAKRYSTRIVWADKGGNAIAAAKQIGATAMRSPYNLDANDLLQRGLLGDFIDGWLHKLGVDRPDRDMTLGGVCDYVGHVLRPTELEKLRQRAAGLGFDVGTVEDGAGLRVVRIFTPGMDYSRPDSRMVAQFGKVERKELGS